MRAKNTIGVLLVVILLPFMLANQNCGRATTWGEKYFSEWSEDHPDIDEETLCVDCHDDITSPKVKPKNHDQTWKRTHGSYPTQKFGFKNENVCYLCHKEADCNSCHMIEEPQQHTEFWKKRGHGAFVGLDRSECQTCHKSVDFCERCHTSSTPISHNASWGAVMNRHCDNCHFPLSSAGARECSVCHTTTPSHDNTPAMPNNALHFVGAQCSDCHTPLRHPDNGMACTDCHQ